MGADLLLPLHCLILLLLLGILQEGDFGSQFSQLSGLKKTITRLFDDSDLLNLGNLIMRCI